MVYPSGFGFWVSFSLSEFFWLYLKVDLAQHQSVVGWGDRDEQLGLWNEVISLIYAKIVLDPLLGFPLLMTAALLTIDQLNLWEP